MSLPKQQRIWINVSWISGILFLTENRLEYIIDFFQFQFLYSYKWLLMHLCWPYNDSHERRIQFICGISNLTPRVLSQNILFLKFKLLYKIINDLCSIYVKDMYSLFGHRIKNYIWECFNPESSRETLATFNTECHVRTIWTLYFSVHDKYL